MNKQVRTYIAQACLIIAVMALAFYVAYIAQSSDVVKHVVTTYGYTGILAVSFVTGFNLIVPVPAIAFLPLFLESGLNFWVTITLITVGITCADSIAYLIGGIGYDMLMKNKKYAREKSMFQRLIKLKRTHVYAPLVFLFVYSIIAPLPNELMVIPLGLLGYRYMQIFPIVLVGNFIFNLIYATGIENLFDFLI